MKRIIAVLLAFTTVTGCMLYSASSGINAEDTNISSETEQQDPVRVRYQYLLTRGLEEVLEQYPMFASFPDYIGFDFYDINGDGTEELVMRRKDNSTIYVFDTEKNTLAEVELKSIFYENGLIVAPVYNGKGLTSKFSPYEVYLWSSEKGKYVNCGSADRWDKSYAASDKNGNAFPDEIDTDGNGIVYFINDSAHDPDTPVDDAEYKTWKKQYFQGAPVVNLSYTDLTQENIDNIDTTLHTVPEVTTTEAVTTTAETTATEPVTTTAATTTTEVTTAATTTAATTTTVTTTTTNTTTAATTTVTTTTAVTLPDYNNAAYDIDSNGVVSAADAVKLIQILTDPDTHKKHPTHGDVNQDGSVDSSDFIEMKMFLYR